MTSSNSPSNFECLFIHKVKKEVTVSAVLNELVDLHDLKTNTLQNQELHKSKKTKLCQKYRPRTKKSKIDSE